MLISSEPNIEIVALFDLPEADDGASGHYRNIVLRTLRKILPREFFELGGTQEEIYLQQRQMLQSLIPFITRSSIVKIPGCISFYSISKYRSNAFKFFFEMISRWLCPGKRLNVVLVCASDFSFPQLSHDVYTICEVMIKVESDVEYEEILRNFPIIEAEITLGIHSEFYAQRILEIKGLTSDDKTALIQGFIAFLVKRFPLTYDRDVFTEMQHILVTCRDEFKADRQSRHLSRMISIQYLFRKGIREGLKKNPLRRHIFIKLFRSHIRTSAGRKRVLSLVVGLNLLRDQETFGEQHLLRAIQHYVPNAKAVDHSFFVHRLGPENICIAYIEIHKNDASNFSSIEIRKLRRELPGNLKNRIEHKLHPVFMPRNEEEIMRNMLILSDQIKYIRDIPQVFIIFDEQAFAHLFFTVILARVLKPISKSTEELLKQSNDQIEYIHDRTRLMGSIRKKYPKEANVFRLKLLKENFLRADQSIDLYKARQCVVAQLCNVFGEVRDYNGGMMMKQHELLSDIRSLLGELNDYDELLLENFFYSLAPVVVRTVLDPAAFRTLFLMLLEGVHQYKQEGYYLETYWETYNVFALVVVEDPAVKDLIASAIQELHLSTHELAYSHAKANGNICIGYICCAKDFSRKEALFRTIEETLKTWDLHRQKSLINS